MARQRIWLTRSLTKRVAPLAPCLPFALLAALLQSKCIGMVPEVKYFVELSTGGGAAGPGGPAEEGGAGAYGGGKRAAKPRRAGGIPSYAIRFQGYPKDDHRVRACGCCLKPLRVHA